MLPDIQPGNTKILYFFNCLLDGMHTNKSLSVTLIVARKIPHSVFSLAPRSQIGIYSPSEGYLWLDLV